MDNKPQPVALKLAEMLEAEEWQMAEKQKGWDMERVTLLRKLKATMGGQQP